MTATGYPAQLSLLVHTQTGGTCYANACATMIRAVECRIVGREPVPHKVLTDRIVARHGTNGGDCEVVLQEECPERQLSYRSMGMTDSSSCHMVLQDIEATLQQRVVLMLFALDDNQWCKFSGFSKTSQKVFCEQKTSAFRTEGPLVTRW
mmetsp:Transcript_37206/g.73710  ORF Transcript_37206/g.73710 Transcript_37206/m.73710 type:complete len:150 (+) Transcript_37206:36-485(+)